MTNGIRRWLAWLFEIGHRRRESASGHRIHIHGDGNFIRLDGAGKRGPAKGKKRARGASR